MKPYIVIKQGIVLHVSQNETYVIKLFQIPEHTLQHASSSAALRANTEAPTLIREENIRHLRKTEALFVHRKMASPPHRHRITNIDYIKLKEQVIIIIINAI